MFDQISSYWVIVVSQLKSPFVLALCAFILIIFIIIIWRIRHRYRYDMRTHLATRAEQSLLKKLNKIVPAEYMIHCQTSMIALVKPLNFRSARRVWAKRMDYVITRKDSRIVMVIELDDRSHLQRERKRRDRFVNRTLKGKHVLLRLTTEEAKNPRLVEKRVLAGLKKADQLSQ